MWLHCALLAITIYMICVTYLLPAICCCLDWGSDFRFLVQGSAKRAGSGLHHREEAYGWSCGQHRRWEVPWTEGIPPRAFLICRMVLHSPVWFQFRLKNCGLLHPIYLVEDFGSSQNMSIPEDTLLQAITNTQVSDNSEIQSWLGRHAGEGCLILLYLQVIDGFFIKRTHDTRESAAYLTLMTRHLQSLYMVSAATLPPHIMSLY